MKLDPDRIVQQIREKGRIVSGSDGHIYFLPCITQQTPDDWPIPLAIHQPAFARELCRICRLSAAKRAIREAVSAVEAACEDHVVQVKPWTWPEHDQTGNVCAINYAVNARYYVKVTADSMTFHPTVGDSMIAVPPTKFQQIRAKDLANAMQGAERHQPRILRALLSRTPQSGAVKASTPAQRVLLLAWWSGLFFDAIAPGRPILGIVGGKGSGKTATARMLGLLFYGTDYEVSGGVGGSRVFKDMVAAMKERPLHIADDQNDMPPEIIDAMCRAATGQEIELAAFHETLSLVSFRVRSSLVITSNRPGWALRDDLLDRMIPIHFAKNPPGGPDESERNAIVNAARTGIFAESLLAVQGALSVQNHDHTKTRFSDWERWVRRSASAAGWLYPLDMALGRLAGARVSLACWSDELVNALYSIADELRDRPAWFTAAQLFDAVSLRMGGVVSVEESTRPSARMLSSPASLSKFLALISRQGSAAVDIERSGTAANVVLWQITPKD
jgi:hypothetical protein